MGARSAHLIASWAELGPEHLSPMLAPFASHPVAGLSFVVLGLALIIGIWAGVGIDGTVRFLSEKLTLGLGDRVRRIQTGRLQDYLVCTVFLTVGVIIVTSLLH